MSLGAAGLGAAAFRGGITPLLSARSCLCSFLAQGTNPTASSSSGNIASCRQQHSLLKRTVQAVVPEHILSELRELDDFLDSDSRLDGRHRSSLIQSAQSLPAALPPHDVEPDLPSLEAHVRPTESMVSCAVKWLRRSGRVPGNVHSLMGVPGPQGGPVWELNVHFDEKELARMVRTFGRNGCTARVLQLRLVRPPTPAPLLNMLSGAAASPHTVVTAPPRNGSNNSSSSSSEGSSSNELLGLLRVKPVRVMVNAVSQQLEGIELLYCPADRVVKVDVPIRLANDEMSPGVRKGGWMWIAKRTVRYKALGNAIPPFIEVNVRNMDLEEDVLVRDLPIPPGTKIYEKNFNATVVRCSTDVGKD